MGLNEVACYESRSSAQESMQENGGSCLATETSSTKVVAKLLKMRTYQDRYILALLQKEALGENPGFQPIHEDTHRAKIVWLGEGKERQPAGYYIYCEQHFEYIKTLGKEVCYPATFSQVYVTRKMRRMGLATLMMRDFIKHHGSGVVWVESPKYETRMLLGKLGYAETERPYELWEMVEGLSRWSRVAENRSKIPKGGKAGAEDRPTMLEAHGPKLISQHG